MTDSFLRLFNAEYTPKLIVPGAGEQVFEIKISVKDMITEVRAPIDVVSGSTDRDLGLFLLSRVAMDIIEGATEALHRENPITFPTYAEYLDYQMKGGQ